MGCPTTGKVRAGVTLWGAILSLAVCAMLCGARSLYAITQWGRDHGAVTGNCWGSARGRRPVLPPSTGCSVFKELDVDAYEAVLGEWLTNNGPELGETLSLDGKTPVSSTGQSPRGIHGEGISGVHLVSAYATRSGTVLAQRASPGKGQELAAAKAVLGQVPLEGRIVVADALLTQREVCQQIVSGGGDYLLPVKENQPTLYQYLCTRI